MEEKTIVSIHNLVKRYGDVLALDHLDLEIKRGEIYGLLGPNGSGKTTAINCLLALLGYDKGSIRVFGEKMEPDSYESKRRIGVVMQNVAVFEELTVRENTYLRGAMLGYTRKFMDEKYDEIIAFAELKDFQERPFKQLSSGMKSRLAFSIACLVSPDILILDEVLSVGDGAFRKKSGAKMKEILKSGVTGILVSHSISQVRELCTKILWLDHARQIAFTDEVELYCNAYEEFLATRKLPKARADIEAMSETLLARRAAEREAARRTEAQKLQALLEQGGSEAAVEAAENVLRKYRPEVLRETAKP